MAFSSPLTRMPPEIIVEIVSYLDTSDEYHRRGKSLRSLSNTSRQLFALANPFLWKDVHLRHVLNCGQAHRKTYADLIRSLTIAPDGRSSNERQINNGDESESDLTSGESETDLSSDDEASPGGGEVPAGTTRPGASPRPSHTAHEVEEGQLDRFLAHWGADDPLFPAVRAIIGIDLTSSSHLALVERIARRTSSIALEHISITTPPMYIALSFSYAAHRFRHLRHIELVVSRPSSRLLDITPDPFDARPRSPCEPKDIAEWNDRMLARHISQPKRPLLQSINIRPGQCWGRALPSPYSRTISSLLGPISGLSTIHSLTTIGQAPACSSSLRRLAITVYSQRSFSTISRLTSLTELSILWGGRAEVNIKSSSFKAIGGLKELEKLDVEMSAYSGLADTSLPLSQDDLLHVLQELSKLKTLRLCLDRFMYRETQRRGRRFLLTGIASYLKELVDLDLDLDCDLPHSPTHQPPAPLPTQNELRSLRLLIDDEDSSLCDLLDLPWVAPPFFRENIRTEPDRRFELCRQIFPHMASFETHRGRYKWYRERLEE